MRRHVYAWLVATIAAVFPTVVTAGEQEDQRIAEHINQRLIEAKDRGSLNDFSLDLYVEEGQVWFKGHVATEAQEKLVFETAQSAKELGVVKIYDMIEVKGKATPSVEQAALKPQQAQENAVRQTSTDLNGPVVSSARRSNTPAPAPAVGSGVPASFAPLQPMAAQQPVARARGGMPLSAAPAARPVGYAPQPGPGPAGYGPQPGPRPAGYAPQQAGPAPANYLPASHPGAIGARHDQPSMPNYAWPAYASHPNYGAVTYPQQYSPSVWPYIGPFYPYPQVPLGWRKVTLEWDDGWWQLDFQDR